MPALIYMLDTDISSYVMKRSHSSVLNRLATTAIGEVCISVITKAEVLYGAAISPRRKQVETAVHDFLRHVDVLELAEDAAQHYADIRADLKIQGTPIGANDMLIAAHARSLDLILVTNNLREFERVQGLKLENWATAKP